MKATDFEFRHRTVLHLMVVGLAVLAYLRDRVDIVWALVRDHSDPASWERMVFGLGAAMLVGSAAMETWGYAHRRSGGYALAARVLLVLAVGLLLPLPGTVILVAGEAILILRLSLRQRDHEDAHVSPGVPPRWVLGFRAAAAKWGMSVSMVIFMWTLQDRLAEIGAVCSVVLGLVLNRFTDGGLLDPDADRV